MVFFFNGDIFVGEVMTFVLFPLQSVILISKAVEKEDNGVSFMETIAMIDGMNNQKHTLSSPDGAAVVSSSAVLSSSTFSATARGNVGDSVANSEDAAQLKKNLQDVQVIADAREKKISEVREDIQLFPLGILHLLGKI